MKTLFLLANLFNMYKVVWQNHQFDIPLNEKTEDYYDLPKPILYDNNGQTLNEDYYITKGVRNTYLSVVNSKYIRKFEVIYRVTYYELGISFDQTIVFNIVDNLAPEFIYIPEIIMPMGSKILTEKDILKDLIYKDNYYQNEELTISIKGLPLVNVNIPGEYEIYYEIVDPSNNINRVKKKYIIVNTVPPEIEFKDPIIHDIDKIFNYRDYFKFNNQQNNKLEIIFDDKLVNYQKIGTYIVSLEVIDDTGLRSKVTTTITLVDNKSPTLIVKDKLDINVNNKLDVRDLIISVKDNYDLLSINDVEITGYLDTSVIDKYEINFEVRDSSNNITKVKSVVNVKDLEKPNIYLKEELKIEVFSEKFNYYNYFEITDNYDLYSDLLISFNETKINYKVLGIYLLEVTVTDTSKNKQVNIFSVKIIDTKAPLVTQETDIYITDFKMISINSLKEHFIINDNYDKNEDIFLRVIKEFKYDEIGSYETLISFKDLSNNETIIRVDIYVIDIYPPSLTLKTNVLNYYVGDKVPNYKDYISNYSDNYSKKEHLTLEVIDDVNYEKEGYYDVLIYLYDEYTNKVLKEIRVIVINNEKPNLIKGENISLNLGSNFNIYDGIWFSDEVHTKNHSLISVDTNKPGKYEMIYYAIDISGNSEYFIQEITVNNDKLHSFIDENKISIIFNIVFGLVCLYYFIKKSKSSKNFDN